MQKDYSFEVSWADAVIYNVVIYSFREGKKTLELTLRDYHRHEVCYKLLHLLSLVVSLAV